MSSSPISSRVQAIADRILERLGRSGARPLNKSELARELEIPSKQRAAFRKALSGLERQGRVERGKKSRYRLPRAPGGGAGEGEVFEGRIEFSRDPRRRSAFFLPDPGQEIPAQFLEDGGGDEGKGNVAAKSPRFFVPGRLTSTALHGDRVRAALSRSRPPKWHRHVPRKRRQWERNREKGGDSHVAEVVEILERNPGRIVGTFHRRGHSAVLAPEDGRLPAKFRIVGGKDGGPSPRPGDMVAAELVEWGDRDLDPVVRVVEVLGREGDPGVDMLAVIHRHGLPLEFPPEVIAEAEAFSDRVSVEDTEGREDWRGREVFTIDPEDAKDFDDAISVNKTEDGDWELAVHIADVSHYVRTGSALDREARKRGNSVYLADRVLPMLPEALSNGLCSLRPGEDRLTQAAVMVFDRKGGMLSARFVSAVIRSARRFTYEEAMERMSLYPEEAAKIGDDRERDLVEHLQRAWRLADLLRKRRFAEGALDLDFPEVKLVLDDEGVPLRARRVDYDESHQLIEEFMLAANEAVAKKIKDFPAAGVFRIHEDPDPVKLEEFVQLARDFGHRAGDPTVRSELQKVLRGIRGKPEERSLKIALLKSLRRAAYSRDPLGHYGLAKANYTHFTSPIRRYADLVVHRVLAKIRSREGEVTAPERADRVPPESELREIAAWISRTERVAADAEMESRRIKMMEYLENLCRDDPGAVFRATVHEARPIGLFTELDDLLVQGLLRSDDLSSRQPWWFDRARRRFVTQRRGQSLGPGDRIEVCILRVDRERGFVDLGLVE